MPITDRTMRLVGQARTALQRLVDDITRRLTAAWAAAWDIVVFDVSAAITEVMRVGGDKWPARGQILGMARVQAALSAVRSALDRLTGTAHQAAVTAVAAATDIATRHQADLVASQLPEAARLPVRAGQVVRDALAAIIARTGQQIASLTQPLSAQATTAMQDELIRGVSTGISPRRAAQQMLARTEGAFNGSLARALNIARTELGDAHRAAAQAAQDRQADVLDGWLWCSALAPNTCAACWAMHGTVHPLDEPGPLDHQSGECIRLPQAKSWDELGFPGMDEPEDAFPDAQAVFGALPETTQLRIMGVGRLDLLNRSAIAWSDLALRRENPGWRDSYVVRPVRDLTKPPTG